MWTNIIIRDKQLIRQGSQESQFQDSSKYISMAKKSENDEGFLTKKGIEKIVKSKRETALI